jgi:uncharacterized protein YndB with AHSA1/START domain
VVIGYSIAFVLFAALALLLLIYAAPRRYQVKVTRVLPAPAERIWPYVSEPARLPLWFPYVAACAHAGGPERGVGQRRLVTLDMRGKPGQREEEVTLWQENQRIELAQLWEKRGGRDVPWSNAKSEFRLAPAGDETAVTGVLWFTGRGPLGPAFSLLSLRKRLEGEYRVALERLELRLRKEPLSAS